MFGLNTITNDKQPTPVSKTPSAVAVNSEVTNQPEQTSAVKKEPKENAKSSAKATVDAFQIYIVQAGVFSSKEAANKAKENLSGESVVFGKDNTYTIVIGASTSESKAKELRDTYKKSSEDAYVKSYEMKGAAQLAESDEKVMSTLQPFMANVMDQVGKAAEGNKVSSVSEVKKELDKIQEQTDNKEIGKLIKTLEQSVSSLESFNQSSKKSDSDEATKYLLTSLVQYQQIIKK
nr:SPOR domain-containing protein [Priestia flexa]